MAKFMNAIILSVGWGLLCETDLDFFYAVKPFYWLGHNFISDTNKFLYVISA